MTYLWAVVAILVCLGGTKGKSLALLGLVFTFVKLFAKHGVRDKFGEVFEHVKDTRILGSLSKCGSLLID